MREPKPWVRLPCLAVIVVAAACAPPDGARPANARATSPATPPAPAPRIQGDESMAALTAEVRQLRVAIEQLAKTI
jgi:hypothetical protein